jgi:hypothetical protein
MKSWKISVVVVVVLLACAVTAGAAEKFGVKVYDGAKYDASNSKSVSQMMSTDAACYRTNDAAAKVIAFYKKQPGLKYTGGSEQHAMFIKGAVHVTVQNPWMDMKSGKMIKETLISIVKQ